MSVSRVTLTVYITGLDFKLSEIKTLHFFCLKTVTSWNSGNEFRPGSQSLHSFDSPPPLSISVLWYFIFSPLHCDLHSSLLAPFFVLSSLISWGSGVSSRFSVWCCAASFLLCVADLSLLRPCPHICGYKKKKTAFLFNKEIPIHTSQILR